MTKMIFINLPVADLPAAKAFYAGLGFVNEPKFTDDTAAAMQWSEAIVVILLTGYLGGAAATHARIGSPLFSHVLFGVYVGLGWPRRRAKQSCSAGSSGPTRRFGTLGTAEWVN